jgi:DNA-binding FadR family transcriptional regulator
MSRPEKARLSPAEGTLETRLPQIEPVRLYRQIADLLSERIDQGVFPIGTLLPAERDLAEQFGVSRTSVREALVALEVAGKVSIRVGHGVQILEATPRFHRRGESVGEVADADISPIQLMEARRHVELRTAALAAANRTQVNLDRMRQAMDLQAKADSASAPQYREGDRNFHVEIARAGGNAAYAVLVASLWNYRSKPLFSKFEELLVGPGRPAKTAMEHRAIFEAVVDRDPAAARTAMKHHLDAVLRAFSRGLGDAKERTAAI